MIEKSDLFKVSVRFEMKSALINSEDVDMEDLRSCLRRYPSLSMVMEDGHVIVSDSLKESLDFFDSYVPKTAKRQSYSCSSCSFKTRRKNHFLKHESLHSDSQEVLECPECTYKCLRNSTLSKHMIIHSSDVLTCEKCSYKTSEPLQLKKHFRYKHEIPVVSPPQKTEYPCEKCSYRTYSESFFARHMKKHDGVPRKSIKRPSRGALLTCDRCSYTTRKRTNLTRHASCVHDRERNYLCFHCGTAFKRQDTLKAHLPVHYKKDSPGETPSPNKNKAKPLQTYVINESGQLMVASEGFLNDPYPKDKPIPLSLKSLEIIRPHEK